MNKDENVHRFSLSAIRGELLKREKEREILSIVKIKRETEREREKKKCDKKVLPKVNRLISRDLQM